MLRSLWRTIIIQKSGAGVAASLKYVENSSFISSLINLTLGRGERTSLKDSDSKYPCFALFFRPHSARGHEKSTQQRFEFCESSDCLQESEASK